MYLLTVARVFCSLLFCFFVFLHGPVSAESGSGESALWYGQPAGRWLEALPVGNGRLGAMIFGGVERERIALNESTVWSGSPNNHENPEAFSHLAQIRNLLFKHEYMKAQEMSERYLLGKALTYGTHVPAGDLYIRFDHPGIGITRYRRELDMDSAVRWLRAPPLPVRELSAELSEPSGRAREDVRYAGDSGLRPHNLQAIPGADRAFRSSKAKGGRGRNEVSRGTVHRG